MNTRRKPATNQRRSSSRTRSTQNLLEVTVRSRLANKQRNRLVLVWMCKLIMFSCAIAGSIYGVRQGLQRFLWENPEYNLAVVEINNETEGVARETILSTANLHLGQNIFTVSLAKARDAISALPQVDHVEMRRVLPNKITIDLAERRPVAWLADTQIDDPSASEKSFLIDSKHVLFKPKRQLPEYLRLPAVYGVPTENFLAGEMVNTPEVHAALELIQQNGDTNRFHLQSIDLSKGYCMVATDSNRAKITFGLDNLDRQLERLGAVLDYVGNNHQEIQTVNLMVERNVPVTFAPPPGQEPEVTPPLTPDAGKASTESVSKPAAAATKPAAEKTTRSKEPSHPSERKITEKKAMHQRASARSKPSEMKVMRAEPVIRRALPITPTDPNQTTNPHGQR